MSDAAAIAFLKSREIKNKLGQLLKQPKIKIAVILIASIGFWFGLYKFFYTGIHFFKVQAGPTSTALYLINSVFYVFFFALFVMLLISNAIISYTSFFKGREISYLFTCPIKAENIFLYKFIESLGFSSWALLFLATPLLFAYGHVFSLPIYFYFISFVFVIVFMFIPAIIGSFVALLIANYLPRAFKISKFTLFLIFTLVVFLLWHFIQTRPHNREGFKAVFEVFDALNFSKNPLFPSFWVSKGIIQLSQGSMGQSFFYMALIAANSFFMLVLLYLMSNKFIQRGFHKSAGIKTQVKYEGSFIEKFLDLFLFFLPKKELKLIILKDLKSFLRDATQWSQFLVFFGILLIYFANLRNFGYEGAPAFWKNVVALMNLLATSLTVTTFASRFVFPLISLEGRKFWVVGMFPLNRSQILFAKFIFSFVMLLVISECLILLSTYMLSLQSEVYVSHMTAMLGICSGISALAVGLGALYPNFREDNPSKIVSGFGGTLNLVTSLGFVILIMFIQSLPIVFSLRSNTLWYYPILSQAAIIAVSLLFTIVPLHLGARAIQRIEI